MYSKSADRTGAFFSSNGEHVRLYATGELTGARILWRRSSPEALDSNETSVHFPYTSVAVNEVVPLSLEAGTNLLNSMALYRDFDEGPRQVYLLPIDPVD